MTTPYDHTGGDRLTLEQQLNKIAGQEARKCAQKTTIPRLRIANEILRGEIARRKETIRKGTWGGLNDD